MDELLQVKPINRDMGTILFLVSDIYCEIGPIFMKKLCYLMRWKESCKLNFLLNMPFVRASPVGGPIATHRPILDPYRIDLQWRPPSVGTRPFFVPRPFSNIRGRCSHMYGHDLHIGHGQQDKKYPISFGPFSPSPSPIICHRSHPAVVTASW